MQDNRYMGEWTTPVSVVLYIYSLLSFMTFLVMFMLCIHRHGCFVSVCFALLFRAHISFFSTVIVTRCPSQFTDYLKYSIFVVADAEEELSDTNNREFACGTSNKPTSLTTSMKTLMKILIALRSTISCLEILLL